MKLSTKGRYGVRAMIELALRYGEGPIALKNVAESQSISDHYLEQLMGSLRKAGLVVSVRGAQGGYMLNKEPGNIRLSNIIRALEGPIAPVDCVTDEPGEEICEQMDTCVARGAWLRLRNAMVEVLDNITLQDLVEETKNIKEDETDNYMYYI